MAKRQSRDKSTPKVETYRDLEITHPTRPEVGTQARYNKKSPPKTYRYDSSLSPSLEWDHGNPAREQAEALIRSILDTDSVEEAKAAAEKLRRMSGPFLNWAGKAERQSFDVPTLPLFIHERLSTTAIVEALRSHRRAQQLTLFDLFADPQHAIVDQHLRAYEHRDPWVNRLILGDNLTVMNSLIHLEKMAGQVQMIYMDPPYGVKFGSNFQPFVRKRDVTNGDDEDMTREPEMVQAFRDTWELGLHSYLAFLRDRLLICRDLLHPRGSIFVQINDENLHYVRALMDEVFDGKNFASLITFQKTTGSTTTTIPATSDYLLWYAKDIKQVKFHKLFQIQTPGAPGALEYNRVELADGQIKPISEFIEGNRLALPAGARVFTTDSIVSKGGDDPDIYLQWEGKTFRLSCKPNRHWKPGVEGVKKLWAKGRLIRQEGLRIYKRYLNDFPFREIVHVWTDTRGEDNPTYVVQTHTRVLERCLLMTTDPGDLVLDPTCGSGTTAYVAEQWGRRWITIDTSRIPLALTRQRLLTATFPWYDLKDESRGPAGGFAYKRKQNKKGEEIGGIVPHITLKSIANNEPPEEEVLVDRPEVVKDIVRVTGPFTVEAIIAPSADMQDRPPEMPNLNGEKGYQERMLEVLRRSPRLQLPGNRTIEFAGARVPARSQWLSAEATLVNGKREPVAIVFGPEHGAINDQLVYNAAIEAHAKQYAQLVVVGFAVEANARRLVDMCLEVCGIPATYVQATMDLTMGDLLKNMKSSQILSVCGLPEIALHRLPAVKGEPTKYQVTLIGLDVFNPITMENYHQDGADVPAWFLCTDYNDRVFHITQAFFPRTSAWDNLKRSLKGVYDDALWQHLAGTTSAPFEAGEHKQVAVKVIDDRGNELMVVRKLDSAEDMKPQERKTAEERLERPAATPATSGKKAKKPALQPSVARDTKKRGRKA